MNPFVLLESDFCVRWVIALLHFLWQGAAVGAVCFLILAMFPKSSARFRANVLLLSLLAMPVCLGVTYFNHEASPSVEMIWMVDSPNAEPFMSRQTTVGDPLSSGATNGLLIWQTFAPTLFMLYAIGVLSMLIHLALAIRGSSRLNRRAIPISDPTLLATVREAARRLGLRFVPPVAYCREIAVPSLIGVIKPTILLPLSFGTGLTPRQVEMVILHELAHYRRWDQLIQPIQLGIEALLFFHPAVWMISNRLRVVREHCCDDLVLASGGSRKEYANVLVQLAEAGRLAHRTGVLRGMALTLAGALPESTLTERIVRMFEEPKPKRSPMNMVSSLSVYLVAAAVLTAIIFHAWKSSEARAEKIDKLAATYALDKEPLDRSPFSGVRWEENRPWVEVDGDWFELLSVDGVSADELTQACI
ncbi:MAG: M56 family metallopeptidase, partial [Candidatus Omnitrophica bacterium]|nr:M56 family metallopeptidase [Candidatus Omnitrophota bacterium]